MKTTQKIFANYSKGLKKRLLPEPTNIEPIECSSFSNVNDDLINFSIEQHGIKN